MTHSSTRLLAGAAPVSPPASIMPAAPAASAVQPCLPASHIDSVIDCLTDHAIATLDAHGNLISWNGAAHATMGFRLADVAGRHFSMFYTEADRGAGHPQRDLHFAARNGLHRSVGWRVRKDAEPFWARVVLQPAANPDGTAGGYVMVLRDMSEHRELQQLRGERGHSRRLEALGRLADSMARDVTRVLGQIDIDHDLACEGEWVAHNVTSPLRCRKLLSQVQAFSRLPHGDPVAANLQDMIATMDALINCAAGDGIELRWRLEAPDICVKVDPVLFQATLLDMVGSACAALPHGGVLTVFTKANPARALCAQGLQDAWGNSWVSVGISIRGAGNVCLLAPFIGGRPAADDMAAPGSGQGRDAWDDLARQAGGALTIESQPDNITTLDIVLPALAAHAAAGEGSQCSRTVLLVDDDENVLSLVGEMLTYLGHHVVPAQDGAAALMRLRTDSRIDCLFTDVVMPDGMNGLELAEEALALRPNLRTMLASIHSRDEISGLGVIPGQAAFFAKPYVLTEIAAYLAAA